MSDDGRVVVGEGYSEKGGYRAVWSQTGKRTREIKPPMPVALVAWGVSADGQVVTGYGVTTSGGLIAPFLWHRGEGFIDINDHPDRSMQPFGLSGDGRMVVGLMSDIGTPIGTRAFRWSATEGLVALESVDGRPAAARAASYNGKVVIGNDWLEEPGKDNVVRACRWLADGPAELLGDLGGETSEARGISADGTVIVGTSQTANGSYQAFQWKRYSYPRMQPLVFWSSFTTSSANAISDQGEIVGTGVEAGETTAFLWTSLDGMKSLNERFRSALPRGTAFHSAEDISADGRWITGRAYHPRRGIHGYILDTGRRK